MRSTNTESISLMVLLCGVLFAGCGDAAEAEREAMREEAAREFGRPADATLASGGGEAPPDTPREAGDPGADGPEGEPAGAETGGSEPRTGGPASGGATAPTEAPATSPVDAPPAPASVPVTTEPPTGQEPGANELLGDADAAYSGLISLRAAFVQRVDLPLVDRTAQGHGVWYQEGRNRFLMDFTDPPDDVFVADGESLWLYQPSATPGQVIKSPLGGGGMASGGADVLGEILSQARSSYDASYEGTAIVSGQRTHVIALTPSGPSDYRLVRVWIADGDRLVRRFRIEEASETIRTVTLADLEPNVPLEDSLFSFSVPEGVQVFARGGNGSGGP